MREHGRDPRRGSSPQRHPEFAKWDCVAFTAAFRASAPRDRSLNPARCSRRERRRPRFDIYITETFLTEPAARNATRVKPRRYYCRRSRYSTVSIEARGRRTDAESLKEVSLAEDNSIPPRVDREILLRSRVHAAGREWIPRAEEYCETPSLRMRRVLRFLRAQFNVLTGVPSEFVTRLFNFSI